MFCPYEDDQVQVSFKNLPLKGHNECTSSLVLMKLARTLYFVADWLWGACMILGGQYVRLSQSPSVLIGHQPTAVDRADCTA